MTVNKYSRHSLIDHPGTFIEEEIEARGWSQADLAYILGMDGSQLNKLIKGATSITPDTAVILGDAFDMPAEFFMNLQKAYDLQHAKQADPGVKTRANVLGPNSFQDGTRAIAAGTCSSYPL